MNKLTVSMREIGSVRVFDLMGESTQESLQDAADKIQRNIRRHRLQRVILNLQMLAGLEPLGLRKLLAACLRPQKSLLFGVSTEMGLALENTYLPRNVRICPSEKEVAEDFGPFLLDKGTHPDLVMDPATQMLQESIGAKIERRRSKRMHVALPIDLKIKVREGEVLSTRAIATNISEGGLFAEYLDLSATRKIEKLEPFEGLKAEILIFPSANFPEEYQLEGKIKRREFRKKQLGVAVEFIG
jgi:hypothetical protein